MKRPPALDSKMEIEMTSPTPTTISGAGVRLAEPRPRRLIGSVSEKYLTLSAFRSTSVYFRLVAPFGEPTWRPAVCKTASPSGPDLGKDEQLANSVEDNAIDTNVRDLTRITTMTQFPFFEERRTRLERNRQY